MCHADQKSAWPETGETMHPRRRPLEPRHLGIIGAEFLGVPQVSLADAAPKPKTALCEGRINMGFQDRLLVDTATPSAATAGFRLLPGPPRTIETTPSASTRTQEFCMLRRLSDAAPSPPQGRGRRAYPSMFSMLRTAAANAHTHAHTGHPSTKTDISTSSEQSCWGRNLFANVSPTAIS